MLTSQILPRVILICVLYHPISLKIGKEIKRNYLADYATKTTTFSEMPAEEHRNASPAAPHPPTDTAEEAIWLWTQIKAEARRDAEAEPALASYLYSTILSHSSLERSLSFHLGNKLCSSTLLSTLLYDLFLNNFSNDPELRAAVSADLLAARYRDPACVSFSHCLLNYKGFLACQVRNYSLRPFYFSGIDFTHTNYK